MKTIGIVANIDKQSTLYEARRVAQLIKKASGTVFWEKELAATLKRPGGVFELERPGRDLEALIVLGGDGTLISVFRRLGDKRLPVLGVNLGGLGFLTEFTLSGVPSAVEDLLQGRLKVDPRATLDCRLVGSNRSPRSLIAVNEVVIGKGGLARVIRVEARIDGRYLTTYTADGVILATPTGSTAYSMSALGPIVSPRVGCFLINPICPHALTNRPLIIADDRVVEFHLISAPPDTFVTVDGQAGLGLRSGDVVRVKKSRDRLRLFSSPRFSYYEILRRKLKWGGSSHYRKLGKK